MHARVDSGASSLFLKLQTCAHLLVWTVMCNPNYLHLDPEGRHLDAND